MAASALASLLVGGSASTVMIPAGARDGEYVSVKTELGATLRVQVPQGFAGASLPAIGHFVPLELERTMIVPPDSPQNSLQVHLHHSDRSSGSSVAISWATPSRSKCLPEVMLGREKVTGVTRTYNTSTLADGSAASFQHVALGHLTDGEVYNYSLSCNGTSFSASFVAPRETSLPGDSYQFAVFGDMGISQAAHDTVASLSAVAHQLNAVYHIGDLSYARGNDAVWNEFFAMIEPVASRMPWDVIPGNHDMRSGDSSGECGLPMLARFETPSSRAAWPALSAFSDAERCSKSFDFATGNPYWWAVDVGHARIITYSTDTNLTAGSPQRKWLQVELEAANTAKARAAHPWVLLMGHKPMYTAATYPGCINTRGKGESAGEGTEGALTAELEELFVANKVDVSFYGHIHSYNRMYPVKDNGTTVERPAGPASNSKIYRSPSAPVHMMIGMSGAGHLGTTYESPAWSAHAEIAYGWLKATFANSSALHLEFIANGDGSNAALGSTPAVHDDVWITK